MQERPDWITSDVDLEKPSAARCYDFYLGGAHNFAADRELGRKALEAVPNMKEVAQNNRAFLRRAVHHCIEQGITQFLDIGSGIPTAGNVHEIAQQADPQARVLYVDNEPVAVAHSRTILDGNEGAKVVQADLEDVDRVLSSPEAAELLDFDKPIAVMMVALLHFVPESADPDSVIKRYYDVLAPGSYLGFSHLTGDHCPEGVEALVNLYKNSTNPATLRTRERVAELLADFELVEPGVVHVPEWHPDSAEDVPAEPEKSIGYAAVGRKA